MHSPIFSRAHFALRFVIALVLAIAAPGLQAQTFTQPDSGTSGTWSVGPWNPTTPVSGTTTALQFVTQGANANAFTFTNDLGAFTANSLTFANGGSAFFTAAQGANALTLGGVAPFIRNDGPSNADITGSAAVTLSASNTSVDGGGNGLLRISAPLAGGAGAGLTVSQTGNGIFALAGANTFPGNVTLTSGNLQLANGAALGTGPLTINGGALRFSSLGPYANNITANASVVVAAGTGALTATSTPTLSGTISGSGGLVVRSYNTGAGATLQGANTYSGATVLRPAIPNSTQPGGTLTLSETNGAILNSTGIMLGKNTMLQLGANANANGNRVADTIPFTIENGTINYVPGVASTTEVLGNVAVTGGLRLSTIAAGISNLQFGSFTRTAGAVLWLPSTNFGKVNSATTATLATFASGLSAADNRAAGSGSGTETGVLPFATAGSATNPRSFVTYDATNGLTVIPYSNASFVFQTTPAAFAADLAAGNLTNKNVYLSGAGSYDLGGTSTTINAITTSGATVTIANGTINLFSGMVVNFDNVIWDTGATLHFPDIGYIHQSWHNVFRSTATITGANGLVIGGYQNGAATGATTFENTPGNPFSGGLFVNGQVAVGFRQDNQLGAAGEPITLAGGGLSYNAAADLEISRAVTIKGNGYLASNRVGNGGTAGDATNATRLMLSGTLSGDGALIQESIGITQLSGTNSYAGGTVISAGTLQFTTDANLGAAGSRITLNGGRLQPLAALTLSRPIDLNSSSTIETPQNLTLAGTLQTIGSLYGTALPTLTKTGAGQLSVIAANPLLSGAVTVSSGELRLSGLGTLGQVSSVNLGAGSSFTIDNTGAYQGDRLADRGAVNFTGAAVASYLAPGTATSDPAERIGPLINSAIGGVFSITGSAASRTVLRFASLKSTGSLTLRGTDLGGTTGNYTRVLFDTPPAANGALIPNIFFANTAGTSTSNAPSQWDSVRGVIPFTPVPVSGTLVDNFASTNTPLAAIFTTTGTATANTGSYVYSLILDGGSSLTLVDGANAPSATNASTPTGTLTLSSGSLTSQNGAKTIDSAAARTLSLGGNQAVITTTSDLTLAANVTLANAVNFTKAGAGNLTVNGPFAVTSPVNVAAGTITFGAPVTFTDLSGSGTINAGANPVTVNSANATTFAGNLTAGSFTKTGTGVFTLSLANAALFTGSTTIGQATLLIGNAATAGAVLSNLTLGSGGTSAVLDLNGFSPAAAVTGITVGGGAANAIINSNVATPSSLTLNFPADASLPLYFAGNLNVTKLGGFTLTLTANAAATPVTTTGGIDIQSGTVQINKGGAGLGSGMNVTVRTGATFRLNGAGTTNNTLPFGTITLDGGTWANSGTSYFDPNFSKLVFAAGGTVSTSAPGGLFYHFLTAGGGIQTLASSTPAIFGADSVTPDNEIFNDTAAALPIDVAAGSVPGGIDLDIRILLAGSASTFRKLGAGLLQLSTTGNQQLANVEGGTLQLNGGTSAATTTGAITVNSSGVLRGSDASFSGVVTVNGGGFIRGGSLATPLGTLSGSSNVMLQQNGGLRATVSRTGAGTAAASLLMLTGAAELQLNPGAGQTFTIDLAADVAQPPVAGESYSVTLAKAATSGKFRFNGAVLGDGAIASANYALTSSGFVAAPVSLVVSGDSLVLTFTFATVPIVTAPSSGNITDNSATLVGTVDDGGSPIAERGVVYSRTAVNADPFIGGTGVTKVVGTGTTGLGSVVVTGLQHGTNYSFRPYAANAVGTGYSTVAPTFITANAPPFAPTSLVRATPGDPTTITLPFSNPDADGDTVTLQGVAASAHVSINSFSGRRVTFTPEPGYTGGASFTYTVSDGTEAPNAIATGTVFIQIAAAPVKNGPLPGGGTLSAFIAPQTGAFAGTVQVGKVKTPAIFGPDGNVLVQVGVNGVAKIGALNGDAVLVTLKTGSGITAKNNVQLLNGLAAGAPVVAAQTGTAYASLPSGITITKFLQLDGQGDTTFTLASLAGAGITPATNLALVSVVPGGPPRLVAGKGRDVTIGNNVRAVSTLATLVASKGTLAANRWRVGDFFFGIRVSFPDKQQAIFAVPASATTSADWIRSDDTSVAPLPGTVATGFGLPGFGLNSIAQVVTLAHSSTIKPTNDRVLIIDPLNTPLARTGDPSVDNTGAPTPDIFTLTIGDPLSGAAGAVAYAGTLKGTGVKPANNSALFFAADGLALKRLARAGDAAPGGGHWSKFSTMVLPTDSERGPIFLATLATSTADSVTTKNNLGLWAVDSTGTLQLLFRTGQNESINGTTRVVKTFTALVATAGSTGAASGYDNSGNVAVLITFTDATQALRVLTVP